MPECGISNSFTNRFLYFK